MQVIGASIVERSPRLPLASGRVEERPLSVGRWFSGLVFAALVAALLLAISVTGGLEERWRQSRGEFFPHAASGKIVLVEIDAKSLAAFGQWPWPRRLHAAMIDRLDQLGSTAIAFDIDFSAHSNPSDDAALGAALGRAKASVILPTFRQPSSTGSADFTENLPIKAFRGQALLASVNVIPDSNGHLARYPYGVVTGGVARPSLAAMLANVPGRVGDSFRIDTSVDPATLPRISAADLLAGRVDAQQVRGKQVVIGGTAIELGDRYATPQYGVIPGVIIQVLAAETLLRGSGAPPVGPLAALVLTLAFIALSGRITGPALQTLTRGIWLSALATTPLILEWLNLPSVEVVPAMIIVGAEWVWTATRRFAARLQAERLMDAPTGMPNAQAFARHNAEKPTVLVIVVRFMWFEEIDAQLDDATRALWAQRTLDRLALGLPEQSFHVLGPGIMAWSEPDADPAALIARIESTSALFRVPLQLGERAVLATPNFGICAGEGRSSRQLVAQATLAARHSQESGRCWSIHSAKSSDEAQRALTLLADIDGAISDGHIQVHYQPKWSIVDNRICGAEALVRWKHPILGPIAPDNFIPLLENSGNMARLTLAIVDICLKDLRSWHKASVPISIAINISASLLEDAGFIRNLRQRLADAGPLMTYVTLEITESAVIQQTEIAIGVLTALRADGVRISIDDYGTGRATLAYLKAFPADEVKIDKSFVTNMLSTVSDQILVRSTIELALELKFKVVAEGVEDAACLSKLAEYGCDIAQGWHIGRPVDRQTFWDKWIESDGQNVKLGRELINGIPRASVF